MSGSVNPSPSEEEEFTGGDGEEYIPLTRSLMDTTGEKVAEFKKENGLNNWQAGCLLFSSITGSGIFILPPFVAKTGYAAFFIFVLLYLQSHYCGVLLGRCWVMTKARNPDHREKQIRFPYAAIAYEAFGTWGKWLFIIVISMYTFTAMTTGLLILSDLIVIVADELFLNLKTTFCSVPPILGIALIPFMFFGTPNDFWFVGVVGTFPTIFAAGTIVLQSIIDARSRVQVQLPTGKPVSTAAVFGFIGSAIYATSGHAVYPTIQHDMSNEKHFSRTLAASNLGGGLILMLVTIPTYIIYGESMMSVDIESVLQVLPNGLPRLMCSIAMLFHFLAATVIVANPLNQQLEELLNIPTGFCWQRCMIRSSVVLMVVFTAESIPHFGVLVPFFGGTVTLLLSIMGPPIFYLRLYPRQAFMWQWESRSMPIIETMLCYICIGIAPLFMFTIIYTGIQAIIRDQSAFTVPCYVNASLAHL